MDVRNMLPEGTTLQGGKYRVEKLLSSGGFGNTYVVINTKFSERYAMKEFFMKAVCERDGDNTVSVSNAGNQTCFDQQLKKFSTEAQRLRKFKNEHIVKVHDLFDENGTSYYIMDYIDGASLFDTMKLAGKPFSEDEVRRFLPQILDGLEEPHGQQIYHLDLHPKNIMLDKAGHVVLIDFGASKQLNLDNGYSTSSAFCYHPGYAPMEQVAQERKRIGACTDMYSLGATLYNLLTMQAPPSFSAILSEHEVAFDMPSSVSESMRKLVIWLMQPDTKERPQCVEEVRRFLMQKPESGKKDDIHVEVQDEVTQMDKGTPPVHRNDEEPFPHERKRIRVNVMKGFLYAFLAVFVCGGLVLLDPFRCNPEKGEHEPTIKKTFTANGVSFTMVHVPGGTFTMGSTDEDAFDDEKITHSVTLSDYYIGETEVTQALWEAVMGSTPSQFAGDNQRPVERVSWEDCQQFLEKLNKMTGQQFRLPTEAQWEYAARGGSKSRGYRYSGSNSIGDVAWYEENSTTHPVKTKLPNELGLYDMSGNVWEWCSGWYGSYSSGSQTNPAGPVGGSDRVGRGGGWNDLARFCRVSCRLNFIPSDRFDNLGLRLAL